MQVIKNTLRHVHCPLCGHSGIKESGKIKYHDPLYFSSARITLEKPASLYKCGNCASGFIQDTIPEEKAISLYTTSSSNKRWEALPFRKMKSPEIVTALSAIFLPQKLVLDVGCNTGEMLDLAKELGSITYGNELSTDSQKVLLEKGHKICTRLEDLEDGSMDVITAFDLIEHIYHVPGFLNLCRSKLKPGGRMVILTGNIQSTSAQWSGSNWWYLKYPEHVVFPSPVFLGKSGFTVEQLIPTYASVGYKRSFFAQIKALIKGKLTGTYQGLSSWGPDHYLAILKNG